MIKVYVGGLYEHLPVNVEQCSLADARIRLGINKMGLRLEIRKRTLGVGAEGDYHDRSSQGILADINLLVLYTVTDFLDKEVL